VKRVTFLFCCFMGSLFSETELVMSVFTEPGNPLLSGPVAEVPAAEICSEEIQEIIDRMIEIAGGERADTEKRVMVGLAAPQIGVCKRIILVDTGANEKRELGQLKVYINPTIVWSSPEQEEGREACYSIDKRVVGVVPRSTQVKMTAFDRQGNFITEEFSGFPARIVQHEVHHLDGIRFPDHSGPEGVLHWVEEEQFPEYRENWQQWPVRCSWDVWLAMKEGLPYELPANRE
jgi:peptide deformylase